MGRAGWNIGSFTRGVIPLVPNRRCVQADQPTQARFSGTSGEAETTAGRSAYYDCPMAETFNFFKEVSGLERYLGLSKGTLKNIPDLKMPSTPSARFARWRRIASSVQGSITSCSLICAAIRHSTQNMAIRKATSESNGSIRRRSNR